MAQDKSVQKPEVELPLYVESGNADPFLSAEKAMIALHRERGKRDSADWNGIALSGGGIRSAIFCLGALQALAENGILRKFDYMSSVSGGGYIASALQWWWHRVPGTGTEPGNFPFGVSRAHGIDGAKQPGSDPATPSDDAAAQAARLVYLRMHGEYLTPDATMSIWSITAVVIRTLFLNLAVWIPLGALLFLIFISALRPFEGSVAGLPNVYSPLAAATWLKCEKDCIWSIELFFGLTTWLALIILAGFTVWVVAFSLDTGPSTLRERDKRIWEQFNGRVGSFLLVTVLLYALLFFDFGEISKLAWILHGIPLVAGALFMTMITSLLLLTYQFAAPNYSWRRWFEVSAGRVSPWITIILAVGSIPVIPHMLLNESGLALKFATAAVGALSGVVSAAFGHKAQRQQEAPSDLSRWIVMIASAVFLYFIAIVAYSLAKLALEPEVLERLRIGTTGQAIARAAIVIAMVLAFFMAFVTNVNLVGLHRFYRDRLMEAFMPDPDCLEKNRVGASPDADSLSITALWPDGSDPQAKKEQKPYPIINANAIMVNDPDRKLASRGGDNFILSPLYVGCSATGWESTAQHIRKNGPLTLASAMTISGAALNANAAYVGVGVTRDRLLSIVMTVLNLRLGLWFRAPSSSDHGDATEWPNHIIPAFLLGLTRLGYRKNSIFVELSDGGHFDNLGIYELVRRKLRVIVAVDGEEDPQTAMPALYSVAQRVEEDFGAIIDLDRHLDRLVPVAGEGYPEGAKFARSPFFITTITYKDDKSAKVEPGLLIYIKLSLVETASFVAKGYRAQNPDFPHQPTADQFFSPEQVDAYRSIGKENATAALKELGLLEPGGFAFSKLRQRCTELNAMGIGRRQTGSRQFAWSQFR